MNWTLHSAEQAPHPGWQASEAGGRWWWLASAGEGAPLAALYALPRQGLTRSRHSFHLGRVVHAAAELGLHQVLRTLQLGQDATGEAEIAGLFDTGAPAPALRALLDAALADLAAQRRAAGQGGPQGPHSGVGEGSEGGEGGESGARVVVELPGARDAAGRSPFWDGLVRHFAAGADARQLAERFGPAWTSHLGALLPRQSIHAAFLPEATQAQLGRPAPSPWLAVLREAGFSDWQHCRIDDGGPLWARPL